MNLTRDRLHTIGWGTALAICFALLAVLTTQVNAVKSKVALADRQIALVAQEKLYLETEFEARASQQQLRAMNDVDFGYTAPSAGQYLKSERDLAALGKLTFFAPDLERFPAIAIAKSALKAGGGAPAAMNAANETAVAAFLDRKIGFLDIAATVAETLERMDRAGELATGSNADGAVEIAMQIDGAARRVASGVLADLAPVA